MQTKRGGWKERKVMEGAYNNRSPTGKIVAFNYDALPVLCTASHSENRNFMFN